MKRKIVLFGLMLLTVVMLTGCGKTDGEKGGDKKTYGFDDVVKFDDLEITIGKDYTIFLDEDDEGQKDMIKLPITIKNLKDETHGLNMFYMSIFNASGNKTNIVVGFDYEEQLSLSDDLRSGASLNKYLYFRYDKDGKYSIELDNFEEKKTIEFDIKK